MANIFKAAKSKLQQLYNQNFNLYNNTGNDVQTDDGTTKILVDRGNTGLTRYAGILQEEFLEDLRGQKGMQKWREMRDNDSTIGAIMTAIENLIKQLDFNIEAAGDTKQDIEAKEFIESVFDDMNLTWVDQISEILQFLTYGSALFEKCYKKRNAINSKYPDGRIALNKLDIRPAESILKWSFDDQGEILGALQLYAPDWQYHFIPMAKCCLFRTRSFKNNPEGRSLFRNAYRSWYFKKNMENMEAIGVERDIAGIPWIKVPGELLSNDATPAQKSALNLYRKMGSKLHQHEQAYIMTPSDRDDKGNLLFEFDTVETKGKKFYKVDEIINRYDTSMARTVMAEFLFLGDKGGSYALSENKTDMFKLSLNSIANIICETINKQVIQTLIKLNTFDNLTDFPKMTHSGLDNQDLSVLSTFIKDMVASMVITPDDDLEDYVREVANLPQRMNYKDTPTQRVANTKEKEVKSNKLNDKKGDKTSKVNEVK